MLHDHIWHKALDQRQSARVMFTDYAKAFDHVDHAVVIMKLTAFGLHDVLVHWFCSLFKGRQQRVVVGKHMSDWTALMGAMPQGSWFGPLTFLVLMNDLTAECHAHKFVDGTTLSQVLGVDQHSRMQNNLDDIVTLSAASLMNINIKKAEEMQLGDGMRKQLYQELTLQGNAIDNVKSYELLGIYVTETLNWDVHILATLSKAFKQIHFLKQLWHVIVSTADLVTYYNSVIRSVIQSACPVWLSSLI